MKVNKFWVVTKPTPQSTIDDICFQTDLEGLQRQFSGGLKVEDIHAMYTDKSEARTAATWLLSKEQVIA